MSGAANMKVQQQGAVNEAIRDRIQRRPTETPKKDFSSNPIYKIMFDGDVSPSERKATFEAYIASTLDREVDLARHKEYEEFREFLSHQNTALAEKIIELTNTGTYASLQKIVEDMNGGLMDFERDLDPLMVLVDSIYQLRTSGVLYDAFREIENDRENDEKRKIEIAETESKILQSQKEINEKRSQNAQLAQKRGMFGFGGITEEARMAIASNEQQIAMAENNAKENTKNLENLKNFNANNVSNLGEMAIHKEKLRELLDLSSEENIGRMVKLRESALQFVKKSKDSSSTIRDEFGQLSERLEDAEGNNRKMTSVYAILNEGMKGAAKANMDKFDVLNKELEESGDNLIKKMDAEEKIRNLNSHSGLLHSAQGETISTYAELHQQAIRVGSMKETTRQQVETARKLNTQGVSATADQLASVMTVVSGAAITESAGVVEQTLERMRVKNNEITQKEVIRNAMHVDKINNQMEAVFAELETFRDTQQASSEIYRNGITVMNENMTALFEQTQKLKEEIKESLEINTVLGHTGTEFVEEVAKKTDNSPFK